MNVTQWQFRRIDSGFDQSSSVDIAGGELHSSGLHELRTMIERRCYDVFQPDGPVRERPRQLAYVGKYSAAKGLPWLLDAFDRLRAQCSEQGVDFATVTDRVTTIAGDVTRDGLGLNDADRAIFAGAKLILFMNPFFGGATNLLEMVIKTWAIYMVAVFVAAAFPRFRVDQSIRFFLRIPTLIGLAAIAFVQIFLLA